MKYSKRTILTAAVIATVSVTGVAAAYSDIRVIPSNKPPVARPIAPPVVEPVPETSNSDTPEATSTTTDTETTTPFIDEPKQTPANNEVVPNEPAPAVEYDPTPEPLPAPDTNITNVENPNNVLGNNTPGNVSHN